MAGTVLGKRSRVESGGETIIPLSATIHLPVLTFLSSITSTNFKQAPDNRTPSEARKGSCSRSLITANKVDCEKSA